MDALAITSRGIEDITALEIGELIKTSSKTEDSCVIFTVKDMLDLCLLCYRAQSVEKILLLFDSFNFKDSDDLDKKMKDAVEKIDFDSWLDKEMTFRVSCKRLDNEDISSEELSGETGALIINKIKKYKQKVDLNNPDITFMIFINKNKAFFGVDFSGKDLHKRDYKVFPSPVSLRSTLAYALVRIADLNEKDVFLDPFCYSGEIPIEAVMFTAQFPVNYYAKEKFSFLKFKPLKKIDFKKFFEKEDKKIKKMKKPLITGSDQQLKHITASKKNSKIAGVNKLLNFTRYDVDWLDFKVKEAVLDKIVSHPPDLTKNTNQKDIEKLYHEFFYQAEYVLKKDGRIVLISKNLDLFQKPAEKYKFKLAKEREVWCGKDKYQVGIFVR